MSTSKNQRSGPRQRSRKRYCPQGHEQTRVKRVPVVGAVRLLWLCECDGYAPIVDVRQK